MKIETAPISAPWMRACRSSSRIPTESRALPGHNAYTGRKAQPESTETIDAPSAGGNPRRRDRTPYADQESEASNKKTSPRICRPLATARLS